MIAQTSIATAVFKLEPEHVVGVSAVYFFL